MGEPSRIDSLQTLGKYALIEKISDGYLGSVYRSFDQDLDRAVDVRILCDGIRWDADLEDLFRSECEAIIRLQHPNLAALFEVSTDGRLPYMVMESLGDRDLKRIIEQKPDMSFETKISIMIQVAEALGCSHKEGILHRNLCPENIFMAGDGCIKVRDFAIAHVLMKHLPHPGVRWGAPIYLSPEQIQHKECGAESDIFALGVIFYELLTGVHPFYAQDGNKALDNILQDKQIPTFEQYPDYHPRIWQILKTCLAKKPDDRYGNVNDMLDAFRGLLKDMAEDVQLMLSELQSAFASLKISAERPGASDETIRLYNKVQNLLRGIDSTDYSRLDRLITKLLEVYPDIRETSSEQKMYHSLLHPKVRTDEPGNSEEERPSKKSAASPPQLKEAGDEAPSPESPCAPVTEKEEELPEGPSPDIPIAKPHDAAVTDNSQEDAAECHSVTEEPQPADFPSDSLNGSQWQEPVPEYGLQEQSPGGNPVEQEFYEPRKKNPLRRKWYRRQFYRVLRPVYRTIAAVMIILLAVIAVQSFRSSGMGDKLRGVFKNYIVDPLTTVKASVLREEAYGNDTPASMESAEILSENDGAGYRTTLLDDLEEPFSGESHASPPQDRLDRVAVMIGSGNLRQAETELDRLRRLYPNASEVNALYRNWQAESSRTAEEQRRAEALETARNKQDAWGVQFSNFFSQGRYKEAGEVTDRWLREFPQSARAHESGVAVEEIQRRMAACNAAMQENRHREALQELSIIEKLNPSDPNSAGLRREIESRMASARGKLTIFRLGDQATLLLDGNPVGDDGEVAEISIPVGVHEIAVIQNGSLVASRKQELFEGQTIALVYDLTQGNIRPMIESDQFLIDRRKDMEEVFSFASEHQHGIFRGGCRGTLELSVYEVIFSPSSGSHGFRIPFKLLNLERDGKTVDLYFISDNDHFKKFEFDDEQTAAGFGRAWNKMKALPRP